MSSDYTKSDMMNSSIKKNINGVSEAEETSRKSTELENRSPRSELPPYICLNTRRLIKPQEIPATSLLPRRRQKKKIDLAKIWCSKEPPPKPIPKYPIQLSWWPDPVCFEINGHQPITRRIWVSNRSCRSINMHICGMWEGDRSEPSARLGASWHCFPRTKIVLAPGLISELYLRGTPREKSPISTALIGIQLATAHKFDQLFGFFIIPVHVTFHNVPKECQLKEQPETEESNTEMR